MNLFSRPGQPISSRPSPGSENSTRCPFHALLGRLGIRFFSSARQETYSRQALLRSFMEDLAVARSQQYAHMGLPSPEERRRFAEDAYKETGRYLYTADDIDHAESRSIPEKDRLPLKQTLHWLRRFIMRPHPALGRSGAVCPYVKSAIDESLLYLSVSHVSSPQSPQEIYEEMAVYQTIFSKMRPVTGPLASLRCILILFPDTPEAVFDDPPGLMNLKTTMLEKDIMIGQFFPTSNIKRLLKAKFFPNQCPVPLYVMRAFIETDWEFLKREPVWQDIYRRKFNASTVSATPPSS